MKPSLLAALMLASLVMLHPPRVEALQISAPFVTVGVGDTIYDSDFHHRPQWI
jgi:hypothetical protein